jgi:hypothetical protein
MSRPHVYVNGLLHYPDDADVVKAEVALTHARAAQRIAGLMMLGMKTAEETEDGDEELLEHVSLYGWLWTLRASELLQAERAAQAQPQAEKVPDRMERSIARKRKGGA